MFSVSVIKSGIQDGRLFGLVLLCICLSAFDAAATVEHIVHGVAVEFNPLMRYLIEVGWIPFFVAKVAMTTLGLWICYALRHQRLGRLGIWLATGIYQVITIYHIYIFSAAYPR